MLIYIVDDNLDLSDFISFALANEGYRVHTFPCPIEALDHMRNHQLQPTLLITDYHMAMLNGYELHQQVNQLAPEVKTIVISERAIQHLIGKLHFLQKPFAPEHLLKLIRVVHST